jgi:hypothetical protein
MNNWLYIRLTCRSIGSIDDGIDKPGTGLAILEDAIDRAVVQRHIPFVAVPTGLVGRVGRVRLMGVVGIFPT